MKKIYLFLFFLFSSLFTFAQDLHTPAEILKIMEKSSITYQLKELAKPIETPDRSTNLNFNDSYRVVTESSILTRKFDISPVADAWVKKAEAFFQNANLDSALHYYQRALKADSSAYFVMTYIGQVYQIKKDYKSSIKWYQDCISKNYIDYMAHWFLADSYLKVNDLKHAVDEIVIAQILNRNNPRITESFNIIFEAAKRKTPDWCFNPQMQISKISKKEISISMQAPWTGYAMVKALWEFEPGYSEGMGVEKGQYSMAEDKEALVMLMVALDSEKPKVKGEPQFVSLQGALDNKFANEFILYEILLPKIPTVARQLPEETILSIKDYILKVRNPLN